MGHEHDNTNIYKQFKELEGEIYTAECITFVIELLFCWMMKEMKSSFLRTSKFLPISSIREITFAELLKAWNSKEISRLSSCHGPIRCSWKNSSNRKSQKCLMA